MTFNSCTTISNEVIHSIKAILFDVNGTLRKRESNEKFQYEATNRLSQLLTRLDSKDTNLDELEKRQKDYRRWAQDNCVQLTEAEIWSKWLLPKVSSEKISELAPELTLAMSNRKGLHVPMPGSGEVLQELSNRNYRLGIISNSMSTIDIPKSLQDYGWQQFFDVVMLSSNTGIRKPDEKIFLKAADEMGIIPSNCAFVGNRTSKDILGCKRAHYGLGIIVDQGNASPNTDDGNNIYPDLAIHNLAELLDIFPKNKRLNNKK
jgi:putative hydrolase of the HAD superfamily